eukprot:00767.XXX_1370_261_1 [CDS] Oithona nana genome sequencing.
MGVFGLRVRRFLAVNTLCIAAMSTLIGLSLVGIGFSTDNWKHISVNRIGVLTTLNESKLETDQQDFLFDHRYFDRVEGMFRVCFPMEEKPRQRDDHVYLYLNTLQEWCTNIDYYMEHLTGPFTRISAKISFATIWLHLARASVASYILYFAAMGVACSVGLFGCWGMSSTKLIATSISLLFAFVFGVSGMGLFHAAHFYETNKV